MCFFFVLFKFSASPSSSGLRAQKWSPWSPHHQLLYNQAKTKSITNTSFTNLNNLMTTIQPIHRASMRRASMTSSRSEHDENYASRLGKKPFKRTNTFDTELLSMININTDPRSSMCNSCDTDNSSSSSFSVEKSASLENVSTRSNPF